MATHLRITDEAQTLASRSSPFKGEDRRGMGDHESEDTVQKSEPHPHPSPPLEGEGAASLISAASSALRALAMHWPEYLMEAAGLGLFMVSACAFTVLLFHPASAVVRALPDADLRRMLTGIAMGLTAITIIYSPLGKRSGAHLNPAVTLTFWRLGKIEGWDAAFYILAQFVGGAAGVAIAARVLSHMLVADPAVTYAVTIPGAYGAGMAFLAEAVISFGLMLMVLVVSNRPASNRYTGL